MSFLTSSFGFLKNSAIFILITAISIPLLYRSTDPKYIMFRLMLSIFTLKHSLIPDRARPTLSPQFRAFENILKLVPFAKFDASADPLTIVKQMRSSFDMNSITPKPSGCQINKEVFEYDGHTVDAYWVTYPARKIQKHSDRILIYTHGGGYFLGDINGE